MIYRILGTVLILLFLGVLPSWGKSNPKEVQQKMTGAIEREAKAQEKADGWNASKQDLINEIRDLRSRLTWVQYQKKKHEIYLEELKVTIAGLEERKLQARRLREELEPFLEKVVARLEAFISQDLPFLSDERQQRLQFLKGTMNDYHLELGEKLRRVYEALSVEATYGKMVTASDETLMLDGKKTEATVFRLGRVAMFYQSLDGKKSGLWNPQTKQWEPISDDFTLYLRRAVEMARRERTIELIQLPIGAAAK